MSLLLSTVESDTESDYEFCVLEVVLVMTSLCSYSCFKQRVEIQWEIISSLYSFLILLPPFLNFFPMPTHSSSFVTLNYATLKLRMNLCCYHVDCTLLNTESIPTCICKNYITVF